MRKPHPAILPLLLAAAAVLPFGFPPDAPAAGWPPPTSVATTTSGRVWHVSGDGNDANDGMAPATAFRTLQKAANLVNPGDTVLIGDGIYASPEKGVDSALLRIDRSGRPDAWITWRAAPGAKPELRPTGWNGIFITGSYHVIDGLTVTGAGESLVLLDAQVDAKIKEKDGKKYPGDPRFNTNGIIITGRPVGPDAKPHHNVIRNCTVSHCGGGIIALDTDYLLIEDNVIFDNSWFTRYATSGISTYENWAHDDAPGYHVIIQRNKVWNNQTLVDWHRTGKLSDGNGIILDATDAEHEGALNIAADAAVKADAAKPAASPTPTPAPKPPHPEWRGRTLVANNLCAFNGGSGIHTFRTRMVDIINNTTYWNGSSVGYAEIFANRSEDVVILNNVIVPRPGRGKVTSNNKNTNLRWDFNVYPFKQDATAPARDIVTGPNDVVADPKFINVRHDLREADFRLAPGSPARDSGSDEVPQPTDLTGAKRPAGTARDRGAFEQ